MRYNFFILKELIYLMLIIYLSCTTSKLHPENSNNRVESSPLPKESKLCNLRWQPTMGRNDVDTTFISEYKGIVFSITSLKDNREEPRIIGKTYKDLKKRDILIPVVTKSSVEKWVRSGLDNVFNLFTLQKSDKNGNLLLSIEITDFSIFDDYTQTGKISLRISAYTKDEMLIWEGNIEGTSNLYLHPMDSDGISECFSNTLIVTIQNLLTNHSFIDAVRKAY